MYGRRHTSIPQSFMAVETVLLVLFDAIGGDGHGGGSADGWSAEVEGRGGCPKDTECCMIPIVYRDTQEKRMG